VNKVGPQMLFLRKNFWFRLSVKMELNSRLCAEF